MPHFRADRGERRLRAAGGAFRCGAEGAGKTKGAWLAPKGRKLRGGVVSSEGVWSGLGSVMHHGGGEVTCQEAPRRFVPRGIERACPSPKRAWLMWKGRGHSESVVGLAKKGRGQPRTPSRGLQAPVVAAGLRGGGAAEGWALACGGGAGGQWFRDPRGQGPCLGAAPTGEDPTLWREPGGGTQHLARSWSCLTAQRQPRSPPSTTGGAKGAHGSIPLGPNPPGPPPSLPQNQTL